MAHRKAKIDGWFSRRGYIHFDHPVSFRDADAYVKKPARVSRHSFFPLIKYSKATPRYRREESKVVLKERPIAYAAHLDSHIYAYYSLQLANALEQVYQDEALSNCVLAYRSVGKCNIDFAAEAFSTIEGLTPCVALAFDVSSFFDTLDHKMLRTAWCDLLGCETLPDDHYAVFKSLTRYATVDRAALYAEFNLTDGKPSGQRRICTPREFRERVRANGLVARHNEPKGIPQGSPISAVLSNVYMVKFDCEMKKLADTIGGSYRRYSDDILWVVPPDSETRVLAAMQDGMSAIGLEANPDKTERSEFSKTVEGKVCCDGPIQYLGFTFDGTRKLVRSQTLARYYRRMKSGVRSASEAAKAARSSSIYRRSLYEKYSHLGSRNFVSYGRRAQKRMKSEGIRRQLKNHWPKLHAALREAEDILP